MNDREYNRTCKSIDRMVSRWMEVLGLTENWIIRLNFCRNGLAPEDSKTTDGGDALAVCDVSWMYWRATISWDVTAAFEMAEGDLETAVVHELVHVALAPMRSRKRHNEEEQATELLAKALRRAHRAGMNDLERNLNRQLKEA